MPGAELVHQATGADGAGGDVNIHDGLGNPLTSTPVGADQALDVNIVAGAGAGGTSSVDGAAFAPGVSALTIGGGEVDDVAPANVAEGASGAFRITPDRSLHTAIWDAAGNNRGLNVAADNTIGVNDGGGNLSVDDGGGSLSVDDGGAALSVDDNGGSLTVDGGVTADIRDGAGNALTSTLIGADQSLDINVTQIVDLTIADIEDGAGDSIMDAANDALRATIVTALPAGGNNIGDVDVLTVPAPLNVVGGGAEAAALRVTIANDSTGQVTIDGTVTAANTAGDVADDAVDSGNPVKIGALAKETDGTDPGSVSAEDDRVELIADRNRRLFVNQFHPNAWVTNNNYGAAQTNQQQKAAPGANLSLYIQKLIISADAIVNILVVDDTAGTPATILGPYYIGANAGAELEFKPPVRVDPNTDIGITSSAAVNHTVTITGFTAP